MRRHELTDRQWTVLVPLLEAYCRKQGGNSAANCLFISAVLWRIRPGVPWRDLPERFGHWNSVAWRFARWADKKVWQRLFAAIQEPDWEWVLVNSTAVKVHPQAAGPKKARPRPSAWAAAGAG